MKFSKLIILGLLSILSCDPPPSPRRPAEPPRLPPDIQESINNLREQELTLIEKRNTIQAEIRALEEQRIHSQAGLGKARYMLKLKLKQSHFSLDLDDHLKDAMNTVELWIAVDREMYDSVNPGSEILDKFRVGSLIMNGSFGSWHIKVVEKKLVEK